MEWKGVEYKQHRIAGQGAYGKVLIFQDNDTKSKIAVKSIPNNSMCVGICFSALREICFLKKLKHPSIMNLLDVIATTDNMLMVMEYYPCNLHEHLKRLSSHNRRLNNKQIRNYFRQLVEGIAYCHKKKVIHRDIKPTNLLLTPSQKLKIGDFGMAVVCPSSVHPDYFKTKQDKPLLSSNVVTIWYRAPELLEGNIPYGTGIDVWGAGCILQELMTGEPLYFEKNPKEQMKRIKELNLADYINPETKFERMLLDLMCMLLQQDPTNRLKAQEALQHPFFIS